MLTRHNSNIHELNLHKQQLNNNQTHINEHLQNITTPDLLQSLSEWWDCVVMEMNEPSLQPWWQHEKRQSRRHSFRVAKGSNVEKMQQGNALWMYNKYVHLYGLPTEYTNTHNPTQEICAFIVLIHTHTYSVYGALQTKLNPWRLHPNTYMDNGILCQDRSLTHRCIWRDVTSQHSFLNILHHLHHRLHVEVCVLHFDTHCIITISIITYNVFIHLKGSTKHSTPILK